MSHTKHQNSEHGTVRSYVIGFILSLIFTAIPYYLVVQKVLSGNALMVTILGIGVIQMLIQIFFFLHLGRGPKPLYNIVFFVSTVGVILVVVGGSVFIMNNLHYMTPGDSVKKLAQGEAIYQVSGEETGACQQKNKNHKIVLSNDFVSPSSIQAGLCDTLTFVSESEKDPEIVFALYPDQGTYGGEDLLVVTKRRSKTINLNQAGTHYFYNRLNPSQAGSFMVDER